MNIDLAKNISELLFQHETVIFPGFGGIVTGYKSASIDYVQGLIHPPSKELTFNEKLTINDGMLERFVRERYDVSYEEAQQAVGAYVTKIQVSLDKGELVFFPKVGRLYRNYERKLQFLQDNTNYNTDTFGLPPVQFYPILRSKDGLAKEAPVPIEQHQMVGTKTTNFAHILQRAMPVLIGFAVVGIAISLFLLRPDGLLNENGPSTLPVSQNINKKPSATEKASMLDVVKKKKEVVKESVAPVVEETVIDEDEVNYENDFVVEENARKAAQKECVIIVGAFSKKSGVQKTVDAIYDLGFDAYQDKKRGLTRVGVQFAYEDTHDIERTLKRVRKTIHHKAWVYKD